MKTSTFLTALALAAFTTGVQAAVVTVADYQFTGNSLASGDAGTNWTTIDLGTGGGLPTGTFNGTEGSPATPSLNFEMGDINESGAFAPDDYYTFTVTPDSGSQIDFTSFTFDFQKVSGGADVDWEVRSSLDLFGSALGSGSISPQGSWVTGNSAAVTGFGNQTTATEFRIFFTTTGTFGPNALLVDNIVVEGDLTAVPEPSSIALIGLAGMALLIRRRR